MMSPDGHTGPGRITSRQRRLLGQALELEDFAGLVRPFLPRAVHGYVTNGADSGGVVTSNRTIFDRWRMVTRVLRDVSARTQATTLFGHEYAAPFGIAPMGSAAVIAFDADNRMARAAASANVPFILSANSITPMEEVVKANPDMWFAAYQSPDHAKIERMVERVAQAGIKVFVLTVDVPVGSNRPADARTGYTMPLSPTPRLALDSILHPRWLVGTGMRTLSRRGMPAISNVEANEPIGLFSRNVGRVTGYSSFTWREAELIRKLWKGPFVLKGVLAAEDVRIAREGGIDGIVVSNHGGRQLGCAVSPMEVLHEIKAKSGDMTVIVDSGFRRGTDLLTACALGADFVLVGRPFLYATALAGEAGLRHAMSLLAREVDIGMGLLGVRTLAELGPEYLRATTGSVHEHQPEY
ncbi:alpha-hydroxy-acid oxidizing protein [Lichenicola cladoniae]|uniref:Alpha-hydroxy-acid oxidizing protein n=1 Tax=Lichenicola cladoniae TaxID=1484109 RepID=A0A6M8HM37_9PROT|nr:alpha-hydroxy acid oxidase [Lichenicola cladoniae]NPD66839.1 alpha-hydroxy-acid oxidizing protein [Acetobacteraceae bacterium]QKE89402.1 alpha-hydroxy-acid oxidizing protein [Lichenicola cladoniae]